MAAIEGTVKDESKAPDGSSEKAADAGTVSAPADAAVEYDRRGVVLPRRARVGGIITPQ